MMFMVDFLLSMVGVLLSVAFFTLMERKLMGLAHYRKGPTKILIFGVSQPIADAAKLLTKESLKLTNYKMILYNAGPCLSIFLMMLCWMFFSFYFNSTEGMVKIVCALAVMSLNIYSFLLMGWGSNSKYALLGAHRAIAQVISYEVCLFLFILASIYVSTSYTANTLFFMQQGFWISVFSVPLFVCWITLCMAESNRTPFDMAEGESEIVSGFNIEYGGGVFAIIFISEYGMILFLSFITVIFFLGESSTLLKTMMMSIVFVWIRCSFPRVRYDKLMMLAWKMMLPYSLAMMSLGLML